MVECSLSKSEETEISGMSYASLFVCYTDKWCFRFQQEKGSFCEGMRCFNFDQNLFVSCFKKLNPGKVCLILDHLAKPKCFYFWYVFQKRKILYLIKHKPDLNKNFVNAASIPRRIKTMWFYSSVN